MRDFCGGIRVVSTSRKNVTKFLNARTTRTTLPATKRIADTMTDLRGRVEKVERDVGRLDASPLHSDDESSKLGTRNFSTGFDRFRMLFERDSPIFRTLE